jgi:S1-C subfamily serine protease
MIDKKSVKRAMLIVLGLWASAAWGVEEADKVTYSQSVVMIRIVQQDFDYVTPWKQKAMAQGSGSGFVIGGNRILTNAHNVANYKYVELKKQNLAKRYPATVSFVGHDCDLAIITVPDAGFFDDTVALELGGLPAVNSTVQTCGFPVGGTQVSITEGVVSRVEMSIYSHSQADSHLVVQTDAAINPGNSGGPVLQDGKVVGVAFQGLLAADNIGYMIPTTVIKHFLSDIEDGKYDGFGTLGITSFPGLHNKSYAEYLKVPEGQEGVVVLSTMLNSSVENVFEAGDVITKVDGYDVDNDGKVHIHGLMLDMSEAIEQKQIGEQIALEFYRGGKLEKATATIALNRPVLDYSRSYDEKPDYEVFAGLVFVPVSRNFLETWGRTWINDIPFYLRYLFHDSLQLNTDRKRKDYVVLSEILPDEINSYCSGFKYEVLESVNGVDIWGLNDLPAAFVKSVDGYCVINFMGQSSPLVLDYSQALGRNDAIAEKYNVPAKVVVEDQL